MLDNYLRLGTTLCILGLALLFLAWALTINSGWQRRRRPAGLEYDQPMAVAMALVLLVVAVGLVVYAFLRLH